MRPAYPDRWGLLRETGLNRGRELLMMQLRELGAQRQPDLVKALGLPS